MLRTAFLIDGFNLFHSARIAARDLGGDGAKWLDIRALCEDHLHVIGRGAEICSISYFSALAVHLEATNPDVTRRHRAFITCLEDTGIHVELAHFKPKQVICPACGTRTTRYEEKETDVAIAIKLLESFYRDHCDVAVLVTADSDIAPAARRVGALFQQSEVWFAFPYARKSKELEKISAGRSFKLSKESYASHQFADPYRCADGRIIAKPTGW
jgi:uncharacterized LabA/DUF88 family protein